MRGNEDVSSAAKNFYQLLGVPETATPEEIKKAYRRLAKKYHPDVTGGDKAKESKFKEFSEAYETLGDAKRRAVYDDRRKSPFGGGGGAGFPGGFPGGYSTGRGARVDLNDLFGQRGGRSTRGRGGSTTDDKDSFGEIFSDLFSGMGFGGATQAREAQQGGRDTTMQVEIELSTAALGGDVTVAAPSGRWSVKIPAGVEEGNIVRVPGKGQPAEGKRPAGDLLIEIKVKQHAQFRRKGSDLEVDVSIPVEVAILGGKVEVPTLEGTKGQLAIQPGTSSGLKLRVKGKGMPSRGGGARGDLYAVVQIQVPRELSPKARELIEEFAKLTRT